MVYVTPEMRIRAAQRRAFCVELRNLNMTFDEIALRVRDDPRWERASFSRSDAYRDVQHVIKEIQAKPGKEYVAHQLLEIMHIKRSVRTAARRGDVPSNGMLLAALKREAEILGSDAPKRTEISITHHFDAMAELVTEALLVALSALPELTVEQRHRALNAATERLNQQVGERPDNRDIIDAETVGELEAG